MESNFNNLDALVQNTIKDFEKAIVLFRKHQKDKEFNSQIISEEILDFVSQLPIIKNFINEYIELLNHNIPHLGLRR